MRPAVACAIVALTVVGTLTPAWLAAAPRPEEAPSASPPEMQPPETLKPDPGPTPPPAIREVSGELPPDVTIDARSDGDSGIRVSVHRDKHLVSIRRGDGRETGINDAALVVPRRELTDAALIWEATNLVSLETIRGVLRLDADGEARTRLAEAPILELREAARKHRCFSYADGYGGATVLCAVSAYASATSTVGSAPREGVYVHANVGGSVARLDLPARPDGAEARVLGYADGRVGVVVRAEASFLCGEAVPSLTVLSSEREQAVTFAPRFGRHRERFPLDEL